MEPKKSDVEIEQQTERPDSAEISINAKGQYSGKIKVYAETIEAAYDIAVAQADLLEKLISAKNSPNPPGGLK